MTERVDFYLCDQRPAIEVAARLVAKARDRNWSVVCRGRLDQLDALSAALWAMAGRFLPHAQPDLSTPGQALRLETMPQAQPTDLLLTIDRDLDDDANAFTRVADVVSNDHKPAARSRYVAWRRDTQDLHSHHL